MATSVAVSAVMEEARVRLDYPTFTSTTPLTSAAALNLVKYAARRLSGIIRREFGSDYFVTRTTLTTQASVDTVSLPANFTDLRQIAWVRSTNDSVPLEMASVDDYAASGENVRAWDAPPKYRLLGETIQLVPCPSEAYTLSLYYDTGIFVSSTGDMMSLQPGWEEWLVLDFCVRARQRENKDGSDFAAERDRVEAEIRREAAQRDRFRVHEVRDLWDGGAGYDSRSLYVRR